MRIACLIDSDFEDSEFTGPYEALRAAGHHVEIIGFQAGKELHGKRGQASIRTTLGIADAKPDDYDALLLPGGYSPDHLRADERMVRFTRAFFDKPRPVFAICHGPQLLITADVVRGRTMTAWKTIQDDLRKVGANVVDQEVVVDGQLVTSRQPSDVEAFSREAVRMLEQVGAGSR
jgi:protease I